MKIAILGTKGIPNNYGGFEQFAEMIAPLLVSYGHNVTVYNPHFHSYNKSEFRGVRIIKKLSPEKQLGASANFIYDFLCLKDALRESYDILLECGYHSSALSYYLLGNKPSPLLITNMDGLEWKRSKWGKGTRCLIKKLEKIAIKKSHYLVSDNIGIQQYYKEEHQTDSFYIAYGADLVTVYDERVLSNYTLLKWEYLLLIARLEPENNIELILDAYALAHVDVPFVVIGNYNTKYGAFLKAKYDKCNVLFVGSIYDKFVLDNLRKFALGYFHGHSVGGTNPSLLEAMASQAFILAHDNRFNRSVLLENALYFSNPSGLSDLIRQLPSYPLDLRNNMILRNSELIKNSYSWECIAKEYEKMFLKLLKKNG